jgi:hypothetical protein
MLIRSWGLFRACWRVLRSQPTLAVYPIISGLTSLIFLSLFMAPLYYSGFFERLSDQPTAPVATTGPDAFLASSSANQFSWQTWVVLFLLGLTLNLVMNFCNAAFTAATLIRLTGSQVTVGEAFSVASARLPAILGYSLIGATVGLALRALEERVGILGRIVSVVIGVVWAVATFMVVPVLVVENVGPLEAIKRSMALLRRTWGEGLVLRTGLGLATLLLTAVTGIIGLAVILATLVTGITPLIIGAIMLTVAALIAIQVVSRTLSGIFTAALYAYATGRGVMPGIPSELITGAFGPKSSR